MQSSGQNCLRVDPALAGIRISAAGVAWLAVSTDRHGFHGGHIDRPVCGATNRSAQSVPSGGTGPVGTDQRPWSWSARRY
jgi:hypothetical protein